MKQRKKVISKTWSQRLYSDSKMIAELYNQRAGYYNALVHILSIGMDRHYRHMAIQRLLLRPGMRVLDIGCGTGMDLPLISQKVGPRGWVVGIDLSERMLYKAHQRICAEKYQNMALVLGNAQELPFERRHFDAIFCNYLLSTVNSVSVIQELFRVARLGASMVFADDRLPSGWFASPWKTIGEFFQKGYFNTAIPGMALLKHCLSSVTLTNHHGGLIFILSGIFRG
jgi:ubiquinone/menaquinone biosynthesis C-methylase UbiE